MIGVRENGGRLNAAIWRLAVVALAMPLLAGCNTDNLLKVSAPSLLPADRLEQPSQAALLVNGAISDFECAIGSTILVEAIISDEFGDAQLAAAAWDYDRRTSNQNPAGDYGVASCSSNQRPGIYTPLAIARGSADNALNHLNEWTAAEVPRRDSLLATAALYSGFDYAWLGMTMCAAAIDLSAPLTPAQLFAKAEERFTTAITTAQGAGLTTILDAAYVGRARVRLFQGNTSGADADAKQVPDGFMFYATASNDNNRRYNRVYASNVQFGFYSVEPQSRDIETEGAPDPRTLVVNTGNRGADGSIIWAQTAYQSESDPIPVATWYEARLISAEAEGGTAAVALINGIRDHYGIPHYSGATDDASIKNLIINERRKQLFVQGFRLYDQERFQLPFNPPVGAPYPDKGGNYGDTRCLPVPDVERFNNPNAG